MQKYLAVIPFNDSEPPYWRDVAGGMAHARNKFRVRLQYHHSPCGFAALFSAPPPKLYSACAYNTAATQATSNTEKTIQIQLI